MTKPINWMKTQLFAAMSDFILPVSVIKGRGAATRLAHRFAGDAREAFDDKTLSKN